jgi:hypothetical protein
MDRGHTDPKAEVDVKRVVGEIVDSLRSACSNLKLQLTNEKHDHVSVLPAVLLKIQ